MRSDQFDNVARDLAQRLRLNNPFGLRILTRSGVAYEGAWSWSYRAEVVTITSSEGADTAIPLPAIDAFSVIDIGSGSLPIPAAK